LEGREERVRARRGREGRKEERGSGGTGRGWIGGKGAGSAPKLKLAPELFSWRRRCFSDGGIPIVGSLSKIV